MQYGVAMALHAMQCHGLLQRGTPVKGLAGASKDLQTCRDEDDSGSDGGGSVQTLISPPPVDVQQRFILGNVFTVDAWLFTTAEEFPRLVKVVFKVEIDVDRGVIVHRPQSFETLVGGELQISVVTHNYMGGPPIDKGRTFQIVVSRSPDAGPRNQSVLILVGERLASTSLSRVFDRYGNCLVVKCSTSDTVMDAKMSDLTIVSEYFRDNWSAFSGPRRPTRRPARQELM